MWQKALVVAVSSAFAGRSQALPSSTNDTASDFSTALQLFYNHSGVRFLQKLLLMCPRNGQSDPATPGVTLRPMVRSEQRIPIKPLMWWGWPSCTCLGSSCLPGPNLLFTTYPARPGSDKELLWSRVSTGSWREWGQTFRGVVWGVWAGSRVYSPSQRTWWEASFHCKTQGAMSWEIFLKGWNFRREISTSWINFGPRSGIVLWEGWEDCKVSQRSPSRASGETFLSRVEVAMG